MADHRGVTAYHGGVDGCCGDGYDDDDEDDDDDDDDVKGDNPFQFWFEY